MVDHDRLFKELITTFFAEFMALFFPEAHRCLDYACLEFMPQEVFTDVTAGEKNIVDILVKTRLQGEEGHILIHVEPQAYREQEFNRRMFKYFARLHEKHGEKVLPIAVFAHDSKRVEPDTYQVTFPFFFVLQFKFLQVHLKRLSWKDSLRHPNPVAAAL
ncbi:MAG: Rpn family recombination-promoting nuclease/putative transposase, partial [Moorella sp. (in: Bacteria)]|nr:Rpn family recombination-promoting nuclease/putative transposase [Moorella sp. (in: firmicutes)]